MSLPKQVRDQAEAAKAHYAKGETPEGQNDPEAGSGAGEDQAAGETAEDRNSQPASGDEPTGTQSEAPAGRAGDDDPETLKQRYKSLQGMYNAEVPRLYAEKRELENRISNLERLLSTTKASAPATAGAPKPETTKLLSQEDLDDFGDSIDVMRKVSREELSPLASRLESIERMVRGLHTDVVPKIESVAKRQSQSSEAMFWSTLAAKVPDWQAVNNSTEFQDWLLEVDPLTGANRQVYLEQAQADMDADRVAAFFLKWLSGQAPAKPARQGTPKSAGSELEKQVAPGRSRGAGRPTATQDGEKRSYSADDIKEFYDDVRKGVYRGKEDERNRIERDIFAAQSEGRISA